MPLKVALIGQAPFGAAVLKALKEAGHEIVGAFTIPDKKREDAVAVQAKVHATADVTVSAVH